MFDQYLREREKKYNEPFREFTHEHDYLQYVDGKPRYEGVRSFLESRDIEIPYGGPDDTIEDETICGIGNRKNLVFNTTLKKQGVEVYESTVALIRKLKEKGIKVGVASSSKNCEVVLNAAGLLDLMETRVDGIVSAKLGLKGKPEPDIFTRAADNLGVKYDRTVVVEDAVSGVQAGKKGNFGLVIGIARENNHRELSANGADLVVSDIEEIGFKGIKAWFKKGIFEDSWSITYHDYDPDKEKNRESLLTVGNGYFGTRGAMEESCAGKVNYPGTYMAGVYNRLVSEVADRGIENEDFVNVINWLPVNFRIGDSDWLDINKVKILFIQRRLDFRNGVLHRKLIIRDDMGRETRIKSKRIVSMQNPHLAAMEYSITPLNYSGKITVKCGLHGDHINAGVERYQQLDQRHLEAVDQGSKENTQFLVVRTTQSRIDIAASSVIRVEVNGEEKELDFHSEHSNGRVESSFKTAVDQEDTLTIHKITGLQHSNDPEINEPLLAARNSIKGYKTFKEVYSLSEQKWEEIWDKIDIRLEGDRLAQKLLRLHLYHLMVTTSPHNARIDFGIPARGLHGEAYRGHIFWDELFILPFYDIHFKETARSVLMYRYFRLDNARKYAREYGYRGVMFPWQSGSSGREETQVLHLNPVSGKWGADFSSLQRHVSLAIAYNIWDYYHITGDLEFIEAYGMEMFLEICRFWAGKCTLNKTTGRYSIDKVMGPDEFHEKYPGAETGGLKDNAYTNLMVAWALEHAFKLLSTISTESGIAVLSKIELTENELESWKDIMKHLNLIISNEGILSQYDGYFTLKELDWNAYRKKYGNIYRMDRLLKAEGKSTDEYKVAKQADTLMTFYNLDKEEVDRMLQRLGYKMPAAYFRKNLDYYLARTSHGSTLSRVVHARLALLADEKQLSWELYHDALTSDYQDIQGGTTGEGIHAGVMAGTIWVALTAYAGLNLRTDVVKLNPDLPQHWRRISFGFSFQGDEYECEIKQNILRIKVTSSEKKNIRIEVNGVENTLITGELYTIKNL